MCVHSYGRCGTAVRGAMGGHGPGQRSYANRALTREVRHTRTHETMPRQPAWIILKSAYRLPPSRPAPLGPAMPLHTHVCCCQPHPATPTCAGLQLNHGRRLNSCRRWQCGPRKFKGGGSGISVLKTATWAMMQLNTKSKHIRPLRIPPRQIPKSQYFQPQAFNISKKRRGRGQLQQQQMLL